MAAPEKELNSTIQLLLDEGILKRIFSGAAASVFYRKAREITQVTCSAGFTDLLQKDHAITENTFFDLASLTKPLVTVLSLIVLLQQEKIRLEDHLGRYFPRLVNRENTSITIGHLLSHSSGLPAHKNYFIELLRYPSSQRKEVLVASILQEKLVYPTGREHLYSDLGFIVLGFLIERISGKTLDVFWNEQIAQFCGVDKEVVFPRPADFSLQNCAATRICPWANRLLCGEVDDDNTRAIGGIAGHAGLFGTVVGVLKLCQTLSDTYNGRQLHGLISQEILRQFCQKAGNSTWTFGFDTPSATGSSSGRYFSAKTIGHLGFTGTSFWIDLEREIGVVLLTNRVHVPEDNEKIKSFRPYFHDAVLEKILLEK